MSEKHDRQVSGYAPGNYCCTCSSCDDLFNGDKRSVTCPACAYLHRIKTLESAIERLIHLKENDRDYDDHMIIADMTPKFKQLLGEKP